MVEGRDVCTSRDDHSSSSLSLVWSLCLPLEIMWRLTSLDVTFLEDTKAILNRLKPKTSPSTITKPVFSDFHHVSPETTGRKVPNEVHYVPIVVAPITPGTSFSRSPRPRVQKPKIQPQARENEKNETDTRYQERLML